MKNLKLMSNPEMMGSKAATNIFYKHRVNGQGNYVSALNWFNFVETCLLLQFMLRLLARRQLAEYHNVDRFF